MINSALAIACFAASVFFAIVCECLRNFLRSRLASVCRIQQNEDRFGIILREDGNALLASGAWQVGSLLTGVILAVAQRYGTSDEFVSWGLLADVVVGMIGGWLLLWVLPWALSRVAAEHVLYHAWPLIHAATIVARPLLNVAQWFDTFMHRMAGRQDPSPESLETIAEEIQSVVDEGEREGILETRSGKMIQRVMGFRQEDIRAVMTPRTDIVTIQADNSLAEARELLLQAGHSRIPVIEGTTDNVLGILYTRDLLEHLACEKPLPLRDIIRPAFYVPETTTIDALLERMQRERLHMAIVLDEYGGVTGLVTLEDILEEIVGNIEDEFDTAEGEQVQAIDAHTIWVDARMHLDELNDAFDLKFPEDRDFDTVGGFVFSELGRVPKPGEKLDWDSLQITVLEATDRKLIRLELKNRVPWPALVGSLSPTDVPLSEFETASLRLVGDSEQEQQAG